MPIAQHPQCDWAFLSVHLEDLIMQCEVSWITKYNVFLHLIKYAHVCIDPHDLARNVNGTLKRLVLELTARLTYMLLCILIELNIKEINFDLLRNLIDLVLIHLVKVNEYLTGC